MKASNTTPPSLPDKQSPSDTRRSRNDNVWSRDAVTSSPGDHNQVSESPFNWLAHTSGMIGGRLYIGGDVGAMDSNGFKALSATESPEQRKQFNPQRAYARCHTVAHGNTYPFARKATVETFGSPTKCRRDAVLLLPPGMASVSISGTPSPKPVESNADQPSLIRRMSEGSGALTEGMIVPDVTRAAKALSPPSEVESCQDSDAFALIATPAEGELDAGRDSGVDFDKALGDIEKKSVPLGWSNWESYAQRHFL